MDLGSITPGEGILHIRHPKTDERLGITITLLSIDDDRMKRIKRRIQDRSIALQRRNKSFDSKALEDNTNELLFAAMTGWTWGVPTDEADKQIPGATPATFEGGTPDFNQDNVYRVFDKLPWFRNQVDEKVSDSASFFR